MGLWSKIKKAAKKVARAVGGAVMSAINTIGEVTSRFFGLVPLVLDLIGGPFLKKKLRVQFHILKSEDGTPLHQTRDLVAECEGAYKLLETVFKNEANIIVKPYGSMPRVKIIESPPPTEALEPSCGGGMFKSLFGAAGSFFRNHKQWSPSILLAGYASPITIFVVRDFQDEHNGCSAGALADFVLVDLNGVRPIAGDDVGSGEQASSTPAHEVGHACGIQYMLGSEHHDSPHNLMFSDRQRGTQLTKAQVLVVRNSRFVTFL